MCWWMAPENRLGADVASSSAGLMRVAARSWRQGSSEFAPENAKFTHSPFEEFPHVRAEPLYFFHDDLSGS
jgi:hypothetical protein